MFFFKKKNQKTFAPSGRSRSSATGNVRSNALKQFAGRAAAFLQKSVFLLLTFQTAQAANLAQTPIGRLNLPWWQARWHLTLAEAQSDPNAKIIWLGDSITEYWQLQSSLSYANILPIWNQYYAPYHALDFGFKGDTTASLIWRLNHGQVAGLHPQLAIILIGANNFGRVHWDAAMTIPAIESVVDNVHNRLPGAHILLLGVLPSIRSAWVDQQTAATNAALARDYANSPIVTFTNPDPVLEKNGRTDADLYMDPFLTPPQPALHPNAKGMSRLAAFIEPEVKKYTE